MMEIIERSRVKSSKRAFSTRRVPEDAIKTILRGAHRPKLGDLVLARVIELGSHKKIELPSGRRAALYPGDEIILAYGNRYAPDQYEAYVPDDLSPCNMVAAGGVAATAKAWHDKLSGPTLIEPIGLLGCTEWRPLNLRQFAIGPVQAPIPANIFAVFGTSMNAGKSTTAAGLVKGLSRLGHTVGVAKITGTGAGGDLWLMRDAGAQHALDFTDAGYPATFGVEPGAIFDGALDLIRALSQRGCTAIVIEVADGLYQRETEALARMPRFRTLLSGTFFAAGDAMGAVAGAKFLSDLDHIVLGISGAVTRSPLASREARAGAHAPVYSLDDLNDPQVATTWATPPSQILAKVAG